MRSNNGILSPKIQWKFRVIFGLKDSLILTQQLRSIDRPKVSIETILTDDGWIATRKYTWHPITAIFGEDCLNKVSSFLETYRKTGYPFDLKIETFNNTNDEVLECWALSQCQITSFDYGKFDYASSADVVKNTIVIEYKTAEQFTV